MIKKGQMVLVGALLWIILLFLIVFTMPTLQSVTANVIGDDPMYQIIPFAMWFIAGIILFRITRPFGGGA